MIQPTGTRVDKAKAQAAPYAIESAPLPVDRYPGKQERIKATLARMRPGSEDSFVPECSGKLVYTVAIRLGMKVRSRPESGNRYRFWRVK